MLSKDLNIPYDGIKNWFETKESLAKGFHKPSKMDKFTESTWRFAFYMMIFFFGVFSLVNVS
jgi:hypothetical protein